MKSFLDHLKEEVLPTVQVADGGLDISKPAVRAAINAAIAGVVSQPAVTPYVVFNRLSKLLAQYHIVLPKRFLEGDKGVEVFELRQFGHKMGMTDSGEFINEVPSTHYLFLQYGILSPFGITYAKPVVGGMFKVAARVVDKEELDKLIDMAEITMNEEAEYMQSIAKANAHGEDMEDVTDDKKKVGNKKAVAASEKKSLDEEDFNAGQVLKNVRDADAVKNPNGPAAMRNKAEDESLERAGKGLARDVKEEKNDLKDTCWKGYTAKGLKKKGNRMVPNCVPVEEAADKDRELSKLANKAISKGHPVKKLPAGRAEYSTLPKGMAKGINLERGRWSGHGRFNEEQIDEVSKSTLGSYIKKASDSRAKNQGEFDFYYKKKNEKKYGKAFRNVINRRKGIRTAAEKLAKEETQIDELSNYTLSNYMLSASDKLRDLDKKGKDKDWHKVNKREHGMHRAANKIITREKKLRKALGEEQIDELKKSTLASYIKKAHVSGLEAASQGEVAYANKDKAGLNKANKTGEKREQGINLAATKLAREEYEKQEAGVKKRSGETHTLHRRNPGHKTEYHTITTERDGRKSVKTGSPKYIKKHWDKLEEETIAEKAPPGAKFERMVKHIKKRYAKGGLTAKEKGIAFATAWKAKNRESKD